MTQLIAHRGVPHECPENTLASFQRSLDYNADMIELDVQLTADHRLAVIHDRTVDRTTDGTGPVKSFTWNALRQLRANAGWDGFADQRVPSLDEVADLVGDRAILNIEIKADDEEGVAIAEKLIAWLNTRRLPLQSVLISSMYRPALHVFVEQAPDVALAVPFRALPDDVPALPFDTWHPRYNYVDADLMALARQQGKRVNVWTVNEEAELRRLIALGVDGIMTDNAGLMRRVLDDISHKSATQ